MRDQDRAVLLGVCMGDGYLNVRKRLNAGKYKYESAELRIVHSVSQLAWCERKAELVRSILGGRFSVRQFDHAPPTMQGKSYRMCGFSVSNGYWKTVKHWLYPGGQKEYTEHYLSMCDAHSAAILYQDDGHLRPHRVNGWITSCTLEISSYCSEAEAQRLVAWLLHSTGSVWKVAHDPRRPEGKRAFLRCNTTEARKFGEAIAAYVHPSMMYKIAHIAEKRSTSAEQPTGLMR